MRRYGLIVVFEISLETRAVSNGAPDDGASLMGCYL